MRADFKGAAYAVQRFMEAAQAEIDRGERWGANRKWKFPHPKIRVGLRRARRLLSFSSK